MSNSKQYYVEYQFDTQDGVAHTNFLSESDMWQTFNVFVDAGYANVGAYKMDRDRVFVPPVVVKRYSTKAEIAIRNSCIDLDEL